MAVKFGGAFQSNNDSLHAGKMIIFGETDNDNAFFQYITEKWTAIISGAFVEMVITSGEHIFLLYVESDAALLTRLSKYLFIPINNLSLSSVQQ